MKLIGRVLLAVFLIAIAFIVVTIFRASNARKADRTFHAPLSKSMTLNSDAFSAGGDIPAVLTCKGTGTTPQLSWSRAPDGAKSFALIVTDWDVPSPLFRLIAYTHWVLFDIPASLSEIEGKATNADVSPAQIKIGENSSGVPSYAPMCPPMGTHYYVFRIYALDVPQLQPASQARQAIFDAMQGHVLAYGELLGRFGG